MSQEALTANLETIVVARRLSKFVENEMTLGTTSSGYPIFAAFGFVAAHYAGQNENTDTTPERSKEVMLAAFGAGYDLFLASRVSAQPQAVEEPHGAV